MKSKMKAVRGILSALAAVSFAVGPLAHAAGSPEAPVFRYAYTDRQTGDVYYNAEKAADNSSWERRVAIRSANGGWSALPKEVRGLIPQKGADKPQLLTYGLKPAPFHDVYYDPKASEIVSGNLYSNSPSGKFGLKIILYFEKFPASKGYAYGYGYQKHFAVLVKNNQNGVIRQMGDFSFSPKLYWLPDGSLMEERYNAKARQNELLRYNPDLNEYNHLMFASLLGYDAKRGQALYTLNEPSRLRRIYDFSTGKAFVASDREAEAILSGSSELAAAKAASPQIPAGLDADSLPVRDVAYRRQYEARLLLNGRSVPLPYAFFGTDRKLYVPLLPLSETLGWTIERVDGDEYRYSVNTGKSVFTLDKRNSKVLEERLFARLDAIPGNTDIGFGWNEPAEVR